MKVFGQRCVNGWLLVLNRSADVELIENVVLTLVHPDAVIIF